MKRRSYRITRIDEHNEYRMEHRQRVKALIALMIIVASALLISILIG